MRQEIIQNCMGEIFNFRDLNGNIVKRNKFLHPYSYDMYVIEERGYNSNTDSSVYSDRMRQWDYEKFNRLKKEVFGEKCGDYFSNFSYENIEVFLSKYFDTEVVLTSVCEGCNVSNGYPYWFFTYRNK